MRCPNGVVGALLFSSSLAAGILGDCAAITVAPLDDVPPTHNSPLQQDVMPVHLDSDEVRGTTIGRGVVFSEVVRARGRPWMRLVFARAELGEPPRGEQPTILRITSLQDGAMQSLTASNLREWENSSAYFNGDAVRIEIIADADAGPSRIVIDHVLAGALADPQGGGLATICGDADDRSLSNDPAIARVLPSGCTAWIIDDFNHTLLSAGHCGLGRASVIEFNVPPSDATGALIHPPPIDQYVVDPTSVQLSSTGVGDDYCYFGCFANSVSGLTPFQRQGEHFALAAAAPVVAPSPQTVRVTGFGTVAAPVSPTWNQAQKSHDAPYFATAASTIQYLADTTGGTSGAPVIDLTTHSAIGIHTNGGCTASGGSNWGTAIHNPGLQFALAHPRGVCTPDPPIRFEYPDGVPTNIDPHGQSIRVRVIAGNNGSPQPGSALLHLDRGSGYETMAMTELSPNVYEAVFPAMSCGTSLRFYFSARSTGGVSVNDPVVAPLLHHSALGAQGVSVNFSDSFEIDNGWMVSNSAGLTAGAWQRGVPIGGGVRNDPPTDADASGQCMLTGNADGDSDIDGGSTTLTSPLLDARAPDSAIAYSRWFVTNSTGADDALLVQVSDDGGASWVNLESVSGATWHWTAREFRIADLAEIDATNQFRIRFIASDTGNAHIVEAGVDAVGLKVFLCETTCAGDIALPHDGLVNTDDLLTLVGTWGACANPTDCPADIAPSGGDDVVNVDDLLLVITTWGTCG